MRLSVIISTYESPEWLEKVLHGYAVQEHRDLELIVADDGSGPETARVIERMANDAGLEIRHVWQPDEGFRKSRILNLAVLEATSDYLVFTDGDCIPRKDFTAVHASRARPGRWLAGSCLRLPMSTSRAITPDDVRAQRCFDPAWLRAHGLPRTASVSKVATPRWLARWRNRVTPTRCRFKGGNASAWRRDVLAVDGFDERMAWGGQDREIGVRLLNAGVRPRHVWYDAAIVHLDHARSYADPEKAAANRRLRKDVARRRVIRTPAGISRHVQDAATST